MPKWEAATCIFVTLSDRLRKQCVSEGKGWREEKRTFIWEKQDYL